ncbi:hypothetical protein SAMN04488505_10826 [Chitinophaga rupis]|uniref:Uncharacterized protein n=1 Tax=Chitinophaga rupis TaxID=573321 RepID=A0A1H8DKI2_9BACT|nr:hypothetical protein SAMN04488505_10826 [Chitinophaga rupis]
MHKYKSERFEAGIITFNFKPSAFINILNYSYQFIQSNSISAAFQFVIDNS